MVFFPYIPRVHEEGSSYGCDHSQMSQLHLLPFSSLFCTISFDTIPGFNIRYGLVQYL